MCLNCKPKPWTIADYEMAIKHATENVKPGEIVDGQMWIAVWQSIVDEKRAKEKLEEMSPEMVDYVRPKKKK